jgi:hypothetical protein
MYSTKDVKPLLALLFPAAVVACGTHDRRQSEEDSCPPVVLDGGGGIDEAPDGDALCPSDGACNYQSVEGCASDESCVPTVFEVEPRLRPACLAAGTLEDAAPCTAWATPSDCAPGYFCAAVPDANQGECRKLCCGRDWSACERGTSCYRPLFIRIDGEELSAETGLCFDTGCDVLDPDSCGDGPFDACKLVDPTGATACMNSGPGEAGDACDSAEYCARGMSCVGNVCRRLCRAEACGVPGCEEGEGTCVHFDRDPEGVGECTPWIDEG